MYAVLGAEGILRSQPEPNTANEDEGLGRDDNPPTDSTVLYYVYKNGEENRVFPIDPDQANTRLSTSVGEVRGTDFGCVVYYRDGRHCVVINDVYPDVVHIVGHAKTDEVSTLVLILIGLPPRLTHVIIVHSNSDRTSEKI